MSNELTVLEAQSKANDLLEIYNIEDILAISGVDEGEILTFLIYWGQIDIPDDMIK